MIPFLALALSAAAPPPTDIPRESGSEPAQLLIVAPAPLRVEADAYASKRSAGLPTRVVTLAEALASSPGMDDAEKLKRFLYDQWTGSAKSLRYVLLIGDADVLPVRYMVLDRVTAPAFDYAFYPSDLYYADLARADGSFDDWNGVKDGFHAAYFGEVRGEKNKSDPINFDRIDYRPEIAVGRWPASTPEEVRAIAAKSLAFERWCDAPDSRRVGLVAVGGWVENRPATEQLGVALKPTWTIETLMWKDGTRDDGTPPPDGKNVLSLLGRCSVILHSGHGSEWSWDGCISSGSIEHMTNAERPAVMMSAGCSTARLASLGPYEAYTDAEGVRHKGTNAGEVFAAPPPPPACYQSGPDNPTGFGEQLVRSPAGAACAYIGCDTGSQPCAMTLLGGFAESLATSDPATRLGDCWSHALRTYYDREHLAELKANDDWYPPSVFFQGMKFVLLGDPSLRLPVRP